MFFPPFLLFFFFGFLFLLFFVFALVQFGLFAWAFSRLGIPPEYLFSFLFLCIAGSLINVPLHRIRLENEPEELSTIGFYGMRFHPPPWSNRREMVLAVNLGGAILPSCLSLYLLSHAENPIRMMIALALLADSRFLLADEPTSDLDEETAQQVTEELFAVRQWNGSLLLATHDRSLAAQAQRQLAL